LPKLTDNQKSLLILGGGVLCGVGFGVMTYLHWTESGEIREEIAKQQALWEKNDKEIKRNKGLKYDFVAYAQIVQNNSKILPTAAYLNEFVRDLGNLEKETGITVKTLPKYDEGKSVVPNILKTPMKLTLGASTRNLLRFLNQLENKERLITITDFRIAPSTAEPKPGQENEHDVSVSFEVYRYNPPAAGATEEALVTEAERTLLLDQKEVKDILEREGRPTLLERYDLMRTREDRRDLFLDPRRRLTGTGEGVTQDDVYTKESTQYAFLELKYRRAKVEAEAYRNVENTTDFLLRAAQKKAFLAAMEALETEIKKVSARTPEFQSRDIQDKYLLTVKRPYEKLKQEMQDLAGEGGPQKEGIKISEEIARGLRQELQALVDARKFPEAVERWQNIDLAFRDAGKRVEEGAKTHLEAMRKLGEHSRFQKLFAEKKLQITGVARMQKPPEEGGEGTPEMVSAIIVGGAGAKESRILGPGKAFDRDVVFRGVEEGGRLLFSYQGHEVDYIPPPPDLLTMQRDVLKSD